jgi:hypothetical protein
MSKMHPVDVSADPAFSADSRQSQRPGDLAIERSMKERWTSAEAILKSASGVCEKLGELLLQAHRITPQQRDFSLAEQKKTGEKIGELLVRLGWLTRTELDAVLALQQSHDDSDGSLRLGNILMAMGVLSRDQLENAIASQRICGKRLGVVLVEAGYAQPNEVVRGLSLQRHLRKTAVTALLSFVAIATAPAAYADNRSNTMAVSAFVMQNTRLHVLSQATQLTITEANIERGYIDVPAASQIEVKSNSRDGFALVFNSMSDLFEAVQITGLGPTVELGTEGGTVVQRRNAQQQSVLLQLGYRFIFSKKVRPGNYAWPIALSARAL